MTETASSSGTSPHFIEARSHGFVVYRLQTNGSKIVVFTFACDMQFDAKRREAFNRACGLRDSLNVALLRTRAA